LEEYFPTDKNSRQRGGQLSIPLPRLRR